MPDERQQVGGVPPYESESTLITFLYLLIRDEVQPGVAEKLALAATPGKLTNPFIAQYAENVAKRLVGSGGQTTTEPQEDLAEKLDESQAQVEEATERADKLQGENEEMRQDIELLRDQFDMVDMKPDVPWQESARFEDAVRKVVGHV